MSYNLGHVVKSRRVNDDSGIRKRLDEMDWNGWSLIDIYVFDVDLYMIL